MSRDPMGPAPPAKGSREQSSLSISSGALGSRSPREGFERAKLARAHAMRAQRDRIIW